MRIPAVTRRAGAAVASWATFAMVTMPGLFACQIVVLAGFSFMVFSNGGCTKKDDAPRPASITGSPAAVPGVTTAPPAGPGPNGPPPLAPSSEAPGATIVGKITLAPDRKGDVTPTDVVYLIARRVADNPGARGALVAVKRFTASSFPIDFTLGAGDMMFKNGAFEGDLTLAARVDKDGDPMTRRKGDVFGMIERVKVGETRVEINLNQVQKQDESLAGAPPRAGEMPSGHP